MVPAQSTEAEPFTLPPRFSAPRYRNQRVRPQKTRQAAGAENLCDTARRTALDFAAQNGRLEAANELLAKGALIETFAADGMTLLCRAIERNYSDLFQLLLENGAAVESWRTADNTEITPLSLALAPARVDAIRFLIARGGRTCPIRFVITKACRCSISQRIHPSLRRRRSRSFKALSAPQRQPTALRCFRNCSSIPLRLARPSAFHPPDTGMPCALIHPRGICTPPSSISLRAG